MDGRGVWWGLLLGSEGCYRAPIDDMGTPRLYRVPPRTLNGKPH